jgi:hypothetical protein
MQQRKLSRDIPDYVLLPFVNIHSDLPEILDSSPNGPYSSGADRRRARREKERLKHKTQR